MKIEKKIEKREIIEIAFDIIILCIHLFVGMAYKQVMYFTAGALAVSYIARKRVNIIYSLLFFYPFFCVFKPSPNGTSLYNYVMLAAIMVLLVKTILGSGVKKTIEAVKKPLILLLVFSVYVFAVGLIWHHVDIKPVLRGIIIPYILLLCVLLQKDDIEVQKLIYAFGIGVIIAGIVGTGVLPVKNLGKYLKLVHFKAAGIRLTRFQGLTVNPNYFSVDVNMAIAGILAVPLLKKGQKRSIFNFILLSLLLVTGFLTLSKSFLVGLIMTVILYVLMEIGTGRLKKTLIILGVLLAIGVIAFIFVNKSYFTAMFARISNADAESGFTSGRTKIWSGYLKYLLNRPARLIIGSGAGAGEYDGLSASHSFYIECIYYFGILGCGILIWLLRELLKPEKFKWIYALPALVFLVRGGAINLVLREAFVTDMIIILAFMRCGQNKGKVEGSDLKEVVIEPESDAVEEPAGELQNSILEDK